MSDDEVPLSRLKKRISGVAKLADLRARPGRPPTARRAVMCPSPGVKDTRAVSRLRLPPRLPFLFRICFGLHSELVKLKSCVDWAALEERLCAGVAAAP